MGKMMALKYLSLVCGAFKWETYVKHDTPLNFGELIFVALGQGLGAQIHTEKGHVWFKGKLQETELLFWT